MGKNGYEPDKIHFTKPPYPWHYFQLKDQKVFGFAGLYDVWKDRQTGCEECSVKSKIPRGISEERLYVVHKVEAINFKGQKYINLDDEAVPIAEGKVPKDSPYFVTARLMQSKVGLRLVVYAGKRGSDQKDANLCRAGNSQACFRSKRPSSK